MSNSKKIIFSIAVFFVFFTVSSVSAIEYGMLGGKPANPDLNIENGSSWFIYSIPAGETKEDAIEVMNLFDEGLEVLVYAADTVKSSGGGFALKQFSEKNESVGSWVKFYPDAVPEEFKFLFEKKESKIVEFCKISREEMQEEFGKKEVSDEQFSSFGNWCKGKDSIERSFSSKERVKIPFTISIPSGADVGEHTGGILIQKKSQDETSSSGGSSVKLTTRVGVRIYETVPGEIVKKINIDYFRAVRNFSEFSFSDWFGEEKKPKEFLLETHISNLGNVSIEHENNLYIKDFIFGKRNEKVERTFQVLKGDKFVANYSWKKPFFGYYSFQPEIRYSNSGSEEVITGEALKMWIIPWREIFIFVFLSGLAGVAVYFWKRRQKKLYGGIGWVGYVVQKGDTLLELAQNCGIGWEILAKTNKIKAPYIVIAGQEMLLPPSASEVLLNKKPATKVKKIDKSSNGEKNVKLENITKEPPAVIENDLEKKKTMEAVYLIALAIGIVSIFAVMVYFYGKKGESGVVKEKISISNIQNNYAVAEKEIPNPASDSAVEEEDGGSVVSSLHPREGIKISVLNGGAVAGSAGKIKELLIPKGYANITVSNATEGPYEGISIYYDPGFEKDAEELARELKASDLDVVVKGEPPVGLKEEIGDVGIFIGK